MHKKFVCAVLSVYCIGSQAMEWNENKRFRHVFMRYVQQLNHEKIAERLAVDKSLAKDEWDHKVFSDESGDTIVSKKNLLQLPLIRKKITLGNREAFEKTMELLLNHGADPSYKAQDGTVPLITLFNCYEYSKHAEKEHKELITESFIKIGRMFIQKSANIQYVYNDKRIADVNTDGLMDAILAPFCEGAIR